MVATTTNTSNLERRTWKAGDNLGGRLAGHDGWEKFSIDSNNPLMEIKSVLRQHEDADGQLIKPQLLRTADPKIKEAIFEYAGAQVQRNVKLAAKIDRADTIAAINSSLLSIEQDLRAGRRVKVTIDSVEVAHIAGAALSKLLRKTEFNGNKNPKTALLKVFVNPDKGQTTKAIVQALGPRLTYKNQSKPVTNYKTFFASCLTGLGNMLNKMRVYGSEFFKDSRPAVQAIMHMHTPYQEKLASVIQNTLQKAELRLEDKMKQLAEGQDVKPVTIKVETIEQLKMALADLKRMAKAYNQPDKEKLLLIELAPDVKKFYKAVILKSRPQNVDRSNVPVRPVASPQPNEMDRFIEGVREQVMGPAV